MRLITLILCSLLIISCSNVSSRNRPTDYNSNNSSEALNLSLTENAGELTEEDIQKILNYRLALPPKIRVAVLNLNEDKFWQNYSSDFAALDAENLQKLVGSLNQSDRVYDASYLPSLVLPGEMTLSKLRTAAARYQADILLTYRSNCQNFSKYVFILPNEAKSYCTVEAAAIDIRSGIVPFTTVSSNEFTAEKSSDDFNFNETKRIAELTALGKCLSEVSTELRRFIEALPVIN